MRMQTITRQTLKDYDVPGARFNPTGLVLESGLPEEEWQQIGRALTRVNQASYFWIGDWIEYGRKLYGIQTAYDLATQATALSASVLRGAARCARKYAPDERHATLSYCHHLVLEKYAPETRARLLTEAATLGLTTRQVRKLAEEECGTQKPNTERKSIVVHLWPETVDRLKQMAGDGHLDWFLTRVVEDWLRWKGEGASLREQQTTAQQRAEREAKGICIMCGARPADEERVPTKRYPTGRDCTGSRICVHCRTRGQERIRERKLWKELPDGATLAACAHS